MKNLLLLIFAFILYSVVIYSQWTNQNPVPGGNHLWSTFFVDENTGWIVGSEGFIKKTTNAGIDWVQQNSGTTFTLRSVQFINQNTGWICGDGGLIIKTTDGGENWFELTSGTTDELMDLQFCDINIGYTVGENETILKSTNGGTTWVTQQSGSTYDLYSVDFVDALLGYAVGGRDSTKFLKTTDGGLNWSVKTLAINNTKKMNCIEFIDANIGNIVGGTSDNPAGGSTRVFRKTTDGGETWFSPTYKELAREDTIKGEHKVEIVDDGQGIRSIYFKDANNGFAVGGSLDGWERSIYITTDAGTTWQGKYFYLEQTGLLSVFVNNAGIGMAVGYYGIIYRTEDGGASWSQILSGSLIPTGGYTGDRIYKVIMVNDTLGWAGGSRKGTQPFPMLLRTTNGGKIWETNFQASSSLWYNEFSKIFFLNENVGWAGHTPGTLYKTTDGGENWYSIATMGNTNDDIFFINQDMGWTIGYNGIYKSTDGGITWVQKSSIRSSSIYFIDINNGWAVGSGGSILKSTDEGESWVSKTSGTSSNLNSVQFYDSNVGMCVGNSGTVLLSTDGGENWSSQSAGTTANLNSVALTNPTTIWIAGEGGTILNTTDLGNSWISYNGTAGSLTSLHFLNEDIGWVCGDNNIFKYQEYITPIELFSFTANFKKNRVFLNWQTATELNNFGFEIERVSSLTAPVQRWEKIGFVEGHGNSTTPNFYSFIDDSPLGGTKLKYRLKQIDTDGKFEYSNEIEVEITPDKYVLFQNYPNPFNPSTKIMYQIPNESRVVIKIYDILGNEVATLINEKKVPGTYEVELNAASLSSGTYIYRIVAGDLSAGLGQSFIETKKMILMK